VNGRRRVLAFLTRVRDKPGGCGRCVEDLGCVHTGGDEEVRMWGGCEAVLDRSVRERRDPKMDDAFDGVEDGMGESPSSYTVVDVVKVLVEDMLGRERSSRASLGLRRVSGTEAEGKCPRTDGRHRPGR